MYYHGMYYLRVLSGMYYLGVITWGVTWGVLAESLSLNCITDTYVQTATQWSTAEPRLVPVDVYSRNITKLSISKLVAVNPIITM